MSALGASKPQKWLYIVFVGGLKSVDIAAPKISLRPMSAPPQVNTGMSCVLAKTSAMSLRVAAVAVGKRMNEDQTMMEPDGDFIGRKCQVFEPIAGVAQ